MPGEYAASPLAGECPSAAAGVEDLLAEQLLFCSQLLLTKVDRLPTDSVINIARTLHTINPGVAIVALPGATLSWTMCWRCPTTIFSGSPH